MLQAHNQVSLPGAALQLPVRRYREAVQWLLALRERLAKTAGSGAFLVGWIVDPRSRLALFAPSLEAEGLPLRNVVFLESLVAAPTLQSACELGVFQAIVVEGVPSAAELQMARRWTKPAALRASGTSCTASPFRSTRSLGASASGALGSLAASALATDSGDRRMVCADALVNLSREKGVLFLG